MEIYHKTRFSIGDEVFFMYKNRVCRCRVSNIDFTLFCKEDSEKWVLIYTLTSEHGEKVPQTFFEHELYATKQELIKFLTENDE